MERKYVLKVFNYQDSGRETYAELSWEDPLVSTCYAYETGRLVVSRSITLIPLVAPMTETQSSWGMSTHRSRVEDCKSVRDDDPLIMSAIIQYLEVNYPNN